MRHAKRGRKLNRTASHKKAMLNNMATSLFEHGSVRTTIPKAKELRGVTERLITFAKRGDLHARRQVLRRIRNKVVVSKLFEEIGPSFADRNGGYTRVLKMGVRRGDSTEICLIELVGDELRSEYATQGDEEAEATVAAEEPEADEASAETEDAAEEVEDEEAAEDSGEESSEPEDSNEEESESDSAEANETSEAEDDSDEDESEEKEKA